MIKLGYTFFAKLTAIALAYFSIAAQAAEKLYVYNWTEYVPSSLLEQFTKETGIEVIYSTFESNEEMYSKLKLSNSTGYDIVFPSSYYVNKMAKEGMLTAIDKTKLSSLKNITPELMGKPFDPDNTYSLPYVYGLTGIGVNAKEIDPHTVSSWQDLWRDEYKGKLLLMNDAREVFHIALLLDGKSPNTEEEAEIKQAYQRLQKLVPNVLVFNSDSPEMPYLQEEVAIGMQWSGSTHRAKSENPDLKFIFPKEGAIIWMDNYVIPKGAVNKEAAHKFIDFLLRPESAKEVIEKMGFSMPNEHVKPLLSAELANDELIFPPKAEINKGILQADVNQAISIYEKYWNFLKTGK
ncbi:extracellular solute-binding protein [[Haemophilus] ducreyi]|uniref:extracellular solute-binding protein n=1 Tax=Haemophilus ducreyi TaxID=730 RepID=UPI00065623E4|nr:extracellular solute-binding protein [[Haemophilus] ducreyi]AKO45335.1 spermidine/putrescine ABC transporter substrate-binding protein [[Haemophilus] ducreyi]AKO46720.1 spermidine/putrescine ABC transporter substrate-binding protein [[Haemophilus] ducreyi]AKO48061.1 spermidine/putrescine ABC transporter substrate-binding protein [[Haemophilus] ducreyi]AKO49448.1 spermidine/putrescine ABC transporter substrate-binding protein [[Haemophilus] ducreyi]OOS03977.1 spermidine/putrescine ABC transp